MSNSLLRVLTALLGVPAIVGLLYLGGWPFTLLVLVVAVAAQHEVYELLEQGGHHPNRPVGFVLGTMLVLQPAYPPLLFAAVATFVLLLAWYPFEHRSLRGGTLGEHPQGISALGATLFGAVYPSGLLGFLLALRFARGPDVENLHAFYLTLAVFVLVWSTDTVAYYVGRSIGKRPLAPRVSPKKTWEGALGGVAGALAAACLLRVLVLSVVPWIHMIAIGALAATVGQLGDLAESKMKRQVGVKDSGTILPGHGGILDRFDAMIVAAPAIYLYLHFVAGLFS